MDPSVGQSNFRILSTFFWPTLSWDLRVRDNTQKCTTTPPTRRFCGITPDINRSRVAATIETNKNTTEEVIIYLIKKNKPHSSPSPPTRKKKWSYTPKNSNPNHNNSNDKRPSKWQKSWIYQLTLPDVFSPYPKLFPIIQCISTKDIEVAQHFLFSNFSSHATEEEICHYICFHRNRNICLCWEHT